MTPSFASHFRREMAQPFIPLYAKYPHIIAAVLRGSTARGLADHFSDIEIGVFWSCPPTHEERAELITQVGGDLIRLYDYDADKEVWCDDLMLGRATSEQSQSGVLVEIVHSTVETLERTLRSVLENYDPALLKQNVLSGMQTSIALKNEELITHWQERLQVYPDGLMYAMLDQHAHIDHFWRWNMYLHRDQNLLQVYELFSQVETKILRMLLALNRTYYSSFKWWNPIIEHFQIAPENLLPRLQSIYISRPEEAAQTLAALVEETYTLLEKYAPLIDAERLRAIFRYERPT